MLTQVHDPQVASPFIWEVQGKNPTVEFSPAVLTALRQRLAGPQLPLRLEFGGILLGSVEGEPGNYRTRVLACEPFPIEHRLGEAYALSPRDRRHLTDRLRRLSRDRLKPVGMFRSHERRGLYLDQRDFELFKAHFDHPASVFLLLGEDEGGRHKGGVFIWEEGDIRRHVSYKEFPLEDFKSEVPSGTLRRAPAEPAGTRTRLPAAARGVGWRPVAMGFLALALPLAAFYAGRELASSRYRRSVLPSPTSAPSAVPKPGSPAATPSSTGPLALQTRQTGRYLEFHWDAHTPSVRQAQLGRLTVKDGGSDLQIWLSVSDLAAGRYMYVPMGSKIEVRLDLYSWVGGQSIQTTAEKQ